MKWHIWWRDPKYHGTGGIYSGPYQSINKAYTDLALCFSSPLPFELYIEEYPHIPLNCSDCGADEGCVCGEDDEPILELDEGEDILHSEDCMCEECHFPYANP